MKVSLPFGAVLLLMAFCAAQSPKSVAHPSDRDKAGPGYSTQRTARVLGTPSNLGNGTVASYAEFDKSGVPSAIGVVFSASALNELPTAVRRASVFRRQQRRRDRPRHRMLGLARARPSRSERGRPAA